MENDRLGIILVKNKVITEKQLDFCLAVRNVDTRRLGDILREYGFATDEDIAKALAGKIGWNYFDGQYVPDKDTVSKLGLDFFIKKSVYPLKCDDGRYCFVLANTEDTEATDEILRKGYRNVDFFVGAEGVLRNALEELSQALKRGEGLQKEEVTSDNIKEWAEALLQRAVAQGATDIHVEPAGAVSEIRFRIDGVLHFIACLPIDLHKHLVNIYCTKGGVDTSGLMRFQDARFSFEQLGRSIDIRLSSLPSTHGPALVLRLLDQKKAIIPLAKLGFAREHVAKIEQMSRVPYGIILVAGPTGSGKTTTLYATLNSIKNISTKIITIEDPVEIQLNLVTQVQVNDKQDVFFGKATRAFLRHDPDVILIGEIRDEETAREAFRASVTGHKVFSTIHTNTPLEALLRLFDLGVEAKYIASTLVGVIGQRLVRKLCPYCRKEVKKKIDVLGELEKKYVTQKEQTVWEAAGCKNCIEGFWGRTVVAEVLYVNAELKKIIDSGDFVKMREYLEGKKDYISLVKDAARLVAQGVTSLEEAVRVLG